MTARVRIRVRVDDKTASMEGKKKMQINFLNDTSKYLTKSTEQLEIKILPHQ